MGCGYSLGKKVTPAPASKSTSTPSSQTKRSGQANRIKGDRVALADARTKREAESRERRRKLTQLANGEAEKARRNSSRLSSTPDLKNEGVSRGNKQSPSTRKKQTKPKGTANGHVPGNKPKPANKNIAGTTIKVTQCSDVETESDNSAKNKPTPIKEEPKDNDSQELGKRKHENATRNKDMKIVHSSIDAIKEAPDGDIIERDKHSHLDEGNTSTSKQTIKNDLSNQTSSSKYISEIASLNMSDNLKDGSEQIFQNHANNFVNDIIGKAKDQYSAYTLDPSYSNETFELYNNDSHETTTTRNSNDRRQISSKTFSAETLDYKSSANLFVNSIMSQAITQVESDKIKLEGRPQSQDKGVSPGASTVELQAKDLVGDVLNNALFQIQKETER